MGNKRPISFPRGHGNQESRMLTFAVLAHPPVAAFAFALKGPRRVVACSVAPAVAPA